MICSVGDKRLQIGLSLAGIKKHYDSVEDINDEEIIITSSRFFDMKKEEFENMEKKGKVIIRYMDEKANNMNVRDLI